MKRNTKRFLGFVAISACAAAASAALPRVIFSNLAASPTSDVPSLPGTKFNPGTASQFDRPYSSPDGQRWIFTASTNLVSTENEVIIVGGGNDGTTAATVVREGTVTFFDAAVNWGPIDTYMGINDAGNYAFNADTTATTTTDEVVVRFTAGGGFELMAREGTQAVGQGPGIGYGSTSDSVNILNDANNTVIFRSATLTGATSQQALFKNTAIDTGSVLYQTDTTVPCNQLTAPDQSIDVLTTGRARSDSDGSTIIYHGDLNGPTATDLFVAVNDCIVAQEGSPLPGGPFGENITALSGDAGSQQVSHSNGHWAFRGSNITTTVDFVVKNGVVAAATDAPIKPGSAELYDDAIFSTTFFINAVNSCGDIVIGGVTNAVDVNANAVLMLNGKIEVLREGDPIDVDGNGVADDNANLSVFNNDDSFLTDDRRYFFFADLRDDAGVALGAQAFMVVQLPPRADVNCDGTVDFFDIDPFLLALFDAAGYDAAFPDCDRNNADVNKDGSVDFFDIDAFLDALF